MNAKLKKRTGQAVWVGIVHSPLELEHAIADRVHHYNQERYHESLDNVTPTDVYEGRRKEILDQRAVVKLHTLNQRKTHNLRLAG